MKSSKMVKATLIGRYNDMIERLEDLADSVELLQAKLDHEPVMPFAEHLEKLKETNRP